MKFKGFEIAKGSKTLLPDLDYPNMKYYIPICIRGQYFYLHSDLTVESTAKKFDGSYTGWYKNLALARKAIRKYISKRRQHI